MKLEGSWEFTCALWTLWDPLGHFMLWSRSGLVQEESEAAVMRISTSRSETVARGSAPRVQVSEGLHE